MRRNRLSIGVRSRYRLFRLCGWPAGHALRQALNHVDVWNAIGVIVLGGVYVTVWISLLFW